VSATRPLVACLCAEWCGSCREYRPTFDALAQRFAEVADFAWIDVEDESDALGDPDIENFPTLLIAGPDRALFFGPVTQQSQTAERLVLGALSGDLVPIAGQLDEANALAERVRRRGRQE
jgi:thioredoxin 1